MRLGSGLGLGYIKRYPKPNLPRLAQYEGARGRVRVRVRAHLPRLAQYEGVCVDGQRVDAELGQIEHELHLVAG